MATYQRFQILSAGRQDLFLPESPVWVSRYQLSLDLETGKRLLQTRMVNVSDRVIRQIFLRIVCLDANRRRITQLELIPLPAFRVLPGRIFGDDKLVDLLPAGVVYAEVYAQRVRFADGSAWDEPGPEGYLAFAAPVPMKESDPFYETLTDRARSGGVRSDFYFRGQQGLWTCTCGLPNATRRLRCAHCGADRLWLEKHMDVNLLEHPAPAPAPKAEPVTVIQPVAAPVLPAPAYEPVPRQPTIILKPAPEPEPEAEPVSHAGRITAIVLAVLVFLGLGAFCAYRYLTPYLRYRQALQEQAAGNYDKAVELFEALEDYKDSPDQINQTLLRKALGLMGEGKYQEAMDLLERVEGGEGYVADCLYSLGVLAFNNKDVDAALGYVNQLRERFPDYDKTETLYQYCCYSMAGRAVAQAAEETDPETRIALYDQAVAWYEQTGGYEDSAAQIQACRYQIAWSRSDAGDFQGAVEDFLALGDYQDSPDQAHRAMFAYVSQHIEDQDPQVLAYLDVLTEADYPGAQELLDRLNGKGFEFQVTLGPTLNPGRLVEVTDLSEVYIHYSVAATDGEGAVLVLVIYTLPDGRQGRGLLNNDRTASGARAWPFPTDCRKSGPIRLEFYDSLRGENVEPLDTVEFQFTYTPSAEGEQPEP